EYCPGVIVISRLPLSCQSLPSGIEPFSPLFPPFVFTCFSTTRGVESFSDRSGRRVRSLYVAPFAEAESPASVRGPQNRKARGLEMERSTVMASADILVVQTRATIRCRRGVVRTVRRQMRPLLHHCVALIFPL